jgi:hypothetical protein
MADIFKKSFYLLKLLARENFSVQYKIMERLDIMLNVKVVESDLAIALKEVKFQHIYQAWLWIKFLQFIWFTVYIKHCVIIFIFACIIILPWFLNYKDLIITMKRINQLNKFWIMFRLFFLYGDIFDKYFTNEILCSDYKQSDVYIISNIFLLIRYSMETSLPA